MRLTEKQLRRIILSVVNESVEEQSLSGFVDAPIAELEPPPEDLKILKKINDEYSISFDKLYLWARQNGLAVSRSHFGQTVDGLESMELIERVNGSRGIEYYTTSKGMRLAGSTSPPAPAPTVEQKTWGRMRAEHEQDRPANRTRWTR